MDIDTRKRASMRVCIRLKQMFDRRVGCESVVVFVTASYFPGVFLLRFCNFFWSFRPREIVFSRDTASCWF